ncbi:MAG: alpha/beta hydrolase [Bacteroidia bacterium]
MQLILLFYQIYFKLLGLISTRLAAQKAFKLFCTPFNKKVRERETEILNTALKSRFQLTGFSIAKYEWGGGDKTALLVHGWEGNAGSLGGFIPLLANKGYHVVAFDAPAHGASDKKQTNFLEFAEVTQQLLRSLQNVEVIIAHSFGSAVSLLSLVRNPQIKIKKLVLLTTPDKLEVPFNDFFAMVKLPLKIQNEIVEMVEKKYDFKVHEMSAAELSKTLEMDTLFIHDTEDKIIPYEFSERVSKSIKGSRLVALKDVGHYRMLWNEDVIKMVDEFIGN